MIWWKSIEEGIKNLEKIPLLLYNSSFDNKLFELWLLEKIKESFINDFGLEIENTHNKAGNNPLWERNKMYIYKLKYKTDGIESIIKIYLQKSKDLIWNDDNKPKWIKYNKSITKTSEYLQGNLDIVITIDDCEEYDPVFIDAKNMYYTNDKGGRSSTVTEKVYKMVGYLDNFNKIGQKHGNGLGILIMKNKSNETKSEEEYRCDTNNSKINLFTINIENLPTNCKVITKYILTNANLIKYI